eukprot:jgi/Undpi1/2113/HiC_scaffold_12.g05499.m1
MWYGEGRRPTHGAKLSPKPSRNLRLQAAAKAQLRSRFGRRKLGQDMRGGRDERAGRGRTGSSSMPASATYVNSNPLFRYEADQASNGDTHTSHTSNASSGESKGVRGGGGSGRVGGGSGSIEGGSGFAGGGKEPAVKTCGIMTTPTFTKLVTLAMMLYYGMRLWLMYYDPATGKLCTFNDGDMCVNSAVSMFLLTVSRVTAGALFPSIAFCILSKCYTTRYFLHHSWLALVVSFEPAHSLHTFFGSAVLAFGVLHGVAHMARNVYDGHAPYMLENTMDRSGLSALALLLPIAIPMLVTRLKSWLSFEFRKVMHMLSIPFLLALCFHTKAVRSMGIVLLVWYLLDRMYFTTRMSFVIENPTFKPVGRGTFVRFDLPDGYRFKVGAYIQVNCPAISATEWHPFSLFHVPGSRPKAGFHVEAVGDWTSELFRLSLENPSMPLWITAAQPSVLEKTIYFDNAVDLSPDMFAKKKVVHLVWLSREASMIAMFEKQLRRIRSTVHLTGNPNPKTKQRMIDLMAPYGTDIITTTCREAAAAASYSSRPPSFSDLTALENGDNFASSWTRHGKFSGAVKGEVGGGRSAAASMDGGTRAGSDMGGDGGGASYWAGSVTGTSILGRGGGSVLGRGGRRQGGSVERGSSRDQRQHKQSSASKRSRGRHPISLHFGRADIERYIRETIQGTAVVAQWADDARHDELGKGLPPRGGEEERRASPPKLRHVLARLNTNQRISKRDLMSADLSVVTVETAKVSSSWFSPASSTPPTPSMSSTPSIPPTCRGVSTDPKTWLVLYCGANAKVEQAVASACDGLNVTWRKEYFSSW